MILIDSCYINSFGGKTLLKIILQKSSNRKFYFLLDDRIEMNDLKSHLNKNFKIIKSNHFNRLRFYKQNHNLFSSVVCLANVPPPIKVNIRTTIYFHNKLLLKPYVNKVGLKNQALNFFKNIYIKYYNNKDYSWVVQTQLMKNSLNECFKCDLKKIFIYPIFNNQAKTSNTIRASNNFNYISSSVSHKNHKRLIKAFIIAAKKIDFEIKLHLTISKEEISLFTFPSNLKIIFHGTLDQFEINELYNLCEFAIYPSLEESFGLPLIEATQQDCKVIASDLPYVHEIIQPSLTFDPYSVESISKAILRAINENLPETKVIVENKIDNLMDFLIRQDVQQ